MNCSRLLLIAICGASSVAFGRQGTLSIEDAVNLARSRNGTIASAYYTYLAARQATIQAKSFLYPNLTAGFVYNSDRDATRLTGNNFATQTEGGIASAVASWRLFDLGVNKYNYLSAARGEASEYATARQTLRQTLFNVQNQYFETLRAVELEKVAKSEVERAQGIYDQTTAQIATGKTPRKDELQAKADLANAKVTELQASNATGTDKATLKSLIGLPNSDALPELPPYPMPDTTRVPTNLQDVLTAGILRRPDLLSDRESLEALHFSARSLAVQAGVTATLDASFGANFTTPGYAENRAFTLTLGYPIFDAGRARAAAREADFNYKAFAKTYEQSERDARAEIESAFLTLRQNVERLAAARDAYAAADENFKAASEAQRLGAATIIDVLTANVSLITAESNQIQAVYDYYISDLKLKLVTGAELLGEPKDDRLIPSP